MSHNTTVRMPEALYQRVRAVAARQGTTVNQAMVMLLGKGLEGVEYDTPETVAVKVARALDVAHEVHTLLRS